MGLCSVEVGDLTIRKNIFFYYSLNPSDDEIETLKREIDQDDNGEIEFNEFLQMMNSKTLR